MPIDFQSCAVPRLLLCGAIFSLASHLAAHGATGRFYNLSSGQKQDDTAQVTVEYSASGHLTLPGEKDDQKVPMSVSATASFQERLLQLATDPARKVTEQRGDRVVRGSVRHYSSFEAKLTINGRSVAPQLREDRRLIGATVEDGSLVMHSPRGSLMREELDLLQLPADSLVADLMLPQRSVKIDSSWKIDDASLALLLGLDAVGQSDVQAELTEVRGRYAVVEASGTVNGAVGGVAADIELKARSYFDLRLRRVLALQLATREKREIGHVNPGVDAVAKIKLRITPTRGAAKLQDPALQGLPLAPNTAAVRLSFESEPAGFRMLHDRDWYVTSDDRQVTVLRRVERGELVAQCNLTRLPVIKEGRQISLETFQDDIRKNLGKHFGRFIRAGQWVDDHGQLVFRVEAGGTASELPVRWLYYLVARTDGQRVAVVFTMEDELAEQFGDADRDFVSNLQVLSLASAADAEPKPLDATADGKQPDIEPRTNEAAAKGRSSGNSTRQETSGEHTSAGPPIGGAEAIWKPATVDGVLRTARTKRVFRSQK